MLKIVNLGFAYQGEMVLENVNLSLTGPEVVAVIGDNGAGKTTLLKLIAGELKPDEGKVVLNGGVGFLRQTQEEDNEFSRLRDLGLQVVRLSEKSGGERTRMRLEKLFAKSPEILLLDEPTNNLDSESKQWLRENLQWYPGLVLMVSHDRDFINQVATRILYINDGKVESLAGNYTDFQERQAQKAHEQLLQYEKAQAEKRKLRAQLQVAGSKAHKSNRRSYDKLRDESKLQANGKRMHAQNSAGKILRATKSKLEQLSDIEKPQERKVYVAKIQNSLAHNKKLLEIINLRKGFGEKELFTGLNLEIRTGEKVRICGRNGSGKSTLFKIILGEIKADAGEVKLMPGLRLGYIAQDALGFDPEKSFLEQNSGMDRTEIYQAAATMDFAPEEMRKPVGELSRGQMTKLAILRLILEPLDLVILDEITNHLDIRARENIELALKNYAGAILMATHDEVFAGEVGMEEIVELS